MAAPSPNTYHSTTTSNNNTIKFLCSYGGKILPRYPDGKLRYHGGQTRLLSVDRSLSFSELVVKLGEVCGSDSVCLRCQLPTEDLDSLVSITCDEDLVNLIEEYERITRQKSLKIKAFLSRHSTNNSTKSGSESSGSVSPKSHGIIRFPVAAAAATNRCKYHVVLTPPKHPVVVQSYYAGYYNRSSSSAGNSYRFYGNGGSSRSYLVHNGSHWQQ